MYLIILEPCPVTAINMTQGVDASAVCCFPTENKIIISENRRTTVAFLNLSDKIILFLGNLSGALCCFGCPRINNNNKNNKAG
jgi:hypothetical protein